MRVQFYVISYNYQQLNIIQKILKISTALITPYD